MITLSKKATWLAPLAAVFALATASPAFAGAVPLAPQMPTDIVVKAPAGVSAVPVTYRTPMAMGTAGKPVPMSCFPKSGELFYLGVTDVLCDLEDARGNLLAWGTFHVTVLGGW